MTSTRLRGAYPLFTIQTLYAQYLWMKVLALLGLCVCGVVLTYISGGLVPWSWRLLGQVMLRLPGLWTQRGVGIVLPLVGLILICLTVLIVWGGIVRCGLIVIGHMWKRVSEQKSFEQDLREAEELAERQVVDHPSWQGVLQRRMEAELWEERRTQPLTRATRPLELPQEEQLEQENEIEDEIIFLEDEETQELGEEEVYEGEYQLLVGKGLDPGVVRKDAPNEDSLFAVQGIREVGGEAMPVGLFVIADGMGGHANGREASQLAVRTMHETIVPTLLRNVHGRSAHEDATMFKDMLKDGAHRANLALYRRNRNMPDMMGTTLTAALIVGMQAYIINVGDSRTYLYREGEGLRAITRDHSVVMRLVERGIITREQIYSHPQRNRIYRCLGEHASVEVDTFVVPVQLGDIFVLCSDGLWEMVYDAHIEEIASEAGEEPERMSELLVQAALESGGVDNISVITVGVSEK